MQLFYDPKIEFNDSSFGFDKDESRHIYKVLRKSVGDIIYITNGRGSLFTAKIEDVSQKSCMCSISQVETQQPLAYKLHVAIAPTKLNDRFEWFLEKATEIGISEITPLLCDHSERKVIKQERMERILQSAMKQSLKAYLPKLNPMVRLEDFIATYSSSGIKAIAHCDSGPKPTWEASGNCFGGPKKSLSQPQIVKTTLSCNRTKSISMKSPFMSKVNWPASGSTRSSNLGACGSIGSTCIPHNVAKTGLSCLLSFSASSPLRSHFV